VVLLLDKVMDTTLVLSVLEIEFCMDDEDRLDALEETVPESVVLLLVLEDWVDVKVVDVTLAVAELDAVELIELEVEKRLEVEVDVTELELDTDAWAVIDVCVKLDVEEVVWLLESWVDWDWLKLDDDVVMKELDVLNMKDDEEGDEEELVGESMLVEELEIPGIDELLTLESDEDD
jgi:hypothetical protein